VMTSHLTDREVEASRYGLSSPAPGDGTPSLFGGASTSAHAHSAG
jgi:hypothetical protein